MLGVTLFGIFLTPVFFSEVQSLGWTTPTKPAEAQHETTKHIDAQHEQAKPKQT